MADRHLAALRDDEPRGGSLFPLVLDRATAFGRCVVVDLTLAAGASREAVAAFLFPEERALARNMGDARLVAFAGGRIAARRAKEGTAAAGTTTLIGLHGEPAATNGVAVSISHSRCYAAAIAAPAAAGTVGVDIEALEHGGPEDLLAERILSDAERAADAAGDPIPILWRLSLKEAAYKALFPHIGHVPLRRIEVTSARTMGRGHAVRVEGRETSIAALASEFCGHVLSYAVAM